MKNLKVLNDYILVQKFDKASAKTSGSPFAQNLVSTNFGEVVAAGDPQVKSVYEFLGKKVYYGPIHETMTVEGKSLLAMKIDNIIAVVEEADGDKA